MVDLIKIKSNRFAYLNKLYEESNGSLNAVFDMDEVGRELNFDDALTNNIVDYLINEDLIESYALGGAIKLTHYGIKEVEQAHEDPGKPTEHFAPINYINITASGQGHIINTGNDNLFQGAHTFHKGEVSDKAQKIINVIENDSSVDAATQKDAVLLLKQLISEADSGKPSNDTLNKVMTMGANIASVGSLVISLFQLIASLN